MTTFDPKKNFAVSTVQVAPTPALTGTALQIALGEGTLFPAAGGGVAFNAIVFPANAAPTVANAEIVRVTSRVGEAFTIVRTQEGTTARAIQVGDRIMQGITVKALTDIEAAVNAAGGTVVLSAAAVLEPGIAGQVSRGRVLTLADFTTLLGLPSPVGGWNLSDLADFSGNGRALTNKGAVPFGSGILGAATEAAVFAGSTGQALYIADAGAGDPFRIPYGTWGCWFRTAKRATAQALLTKSDSTANNGWQLIVNNDAVYFSFNNTNVVQGVSQVNDDRYHFGVATYDGTTISIYVDGALDAQTAFAGGPITYAGAYPLNVGGRAADGATAATIPMFGRVDEAFVTQDVLSADQVRMLYAAKVAHGFGQAPASAKVSVRRQRKGAALAAAIFSTAPLHLYNFIAGALTDAGSLGNALTNNGAAVAAPAPDGVQGNAYNFVASATQYLSATDAGIATTTRTYGLWFKSTSANQPLVTAGVGGAAPDQIYLGSGGIFGMVAGNVNVASLVNGADGQWHFAVLSIDTAAADGLKAKLYLDAKLVQTSTTAGALTLVGANGFRLGHDSSANYMTGQLDAAFVTGYAMGADEIAKLYAQGSQSLGVSPKNAGDHVEGMDATSVYLVADSLDSQHLLDLEVTA